MLGVLGVQTEHRHGLDHVTSFDRHLKDQYEAMTEWGVAHYAGAWFRPYPGHVITFQSGPFRTSEEAKEEQQRLLKEFGYTPPRWWQWWRWEEYRYDRPS